MEILVLLREPCQVVDLLEILVLLIEAGFLMLLEMIVFAFLLVCLWHEWLFFSFCVCNIPIS